jgi:hypothetical protein
VKRIYADSTSDGKNGWQTANTFVLTSTLIDTVNLLLLAIVQGVEALLWRPLATSDAP